MSAPLLPLVDRGVTTVGFAGPRPRSRVIDVESHRHALGAFIRSQRQLAEFSLRQVAALADISNPYLSQVERGLHEPSMRVLRSIAQALDLSAETLLEQAGMLDNDRPARTGTEAAIRGDPWDDPQKQALLSVYRSYAAANRAESGAESSG